MGDADRLPPVAKTDRRATVAWWVVFCGPVAVAVSVGIAGIVAGDGVLAVWTFAIGVWALAMTVGLAAAPHDAKADWFLKTFLGAMAALGAAAALLFAVSKVGVAVREDLATTTTTSTSTSTTAPPGTSSTSVP